MFKCLMKFVVDVSWFMIYPPLYSISVAQFCLCGSVLCRVSFKFISPWRRGKCGFL